MSRAELLYYEPFSFSIETMGQMFYLASPTSVRGKAVSTTGQISFADGHGEQDLPVTNEKVTVEGVMPFHDYDARLADKTQYLQPRVLVMVLRALLKHQVVMRVKCPYLAFDEICVISDFAWEPVPASEGDMKYTVTFDTCRSSVLPEVPEDGLIEL